MATVMQQHPVIEEALLWQTVTNGSWRRGGEEERRGGYTTTDRRGNRKRGNVWIDLRTAGEWKERGVSQEKRERWVKDRTQEEERTLKYIQGTLQRGNISFFCDSSVIMTIIQSLMWNISSGVHFRKKQNMRGKKKKSFESHLKRHFLVKWLLCSKPAANTFISGIQTWKRCM